MKALLFAALLMLLPVSAIAGTGIYISPPRFSIDIEVGPGNHYRQRNFHSERECHEFYDKHYRHRRGWEKRSQPRYRCFEHRR